MALWLVTGILSTNHNEARVDMISDHLRRFKEKATQEKFVLEEAQRKGHRERREKGEDWVPKLFERDPAAPNAINRWVYKYRE